MDSQSLAALQQELMERDKMQLRQCFNWIDALTEKAKALEDRELAEYIFRNIVRPGKQLKRKFGFTTDFE